MLTITIETDDRMVTFRLRGRLAGAGVRELARHWSSAVFKQPHRRVSFDLAGLTSTDESGREFLARVHEYGDILVGAARTGIASEAPDRADTGAPHRVRIVRNEPFRGAELRRDGELARDADEDQQPAGQTTGDHSASGVLIG